MMKKTKILAAAAISVMAFSLLAGCSGGQKETEPAETAEETVMPEGSRDNEPETEAEESSGKPVQAESSGAEEAVSEEMTAAGSEETPEDGGETKPEPRPVGHKGDDWILPDADSYIYEKEALGALSEEELRLARNELYARHGRVFDSQDLKDYFSEKDWYKPAENVGRDDQILFNEFETENLKRLQELEGKEVYLSCPRIGVEDFPKLDGSTATLPISQAIYRLATGASQEEAEQAIIHYKTSQSYMNLAQLSFPVDLYSMTSDPEERPDLVIAYEPGEDVRSRLKDAGDPLDIRPIGRDALVFLVNDSNPVQSVTGEQIADIYGGDITNWSDVGGKDEKIVAFQRNLNSGSQNLMESLVMKGRPMAEAPEAYYSADMGELVGSIASYDNSGNALGYSVYYYVQNMYMLPGIRLLGIDGVAPDTDSIREGSYPYVNDFYAAVRKDEPNDSPAYQLFEWLTSDNGQSLINGLGYVGVTGASRKLPEILTQEEPEYGQIPLPEGTLIAYNMQSGVGFFDGRMRLVHFVGNVGTEDEFYYIYYRHMESNEYRTDRLIPLWSNGAHGETGYGLYSLKDKKWVYPPPCGKLVQRKDGYLLTSVGENDEAIYVDWEGNILMSGEKVLDIADKWNAADDPMGYYHFMDGQTFAEVYPEIMEKHGTTEAVWMTDYPEVDEKCVAVLTEKTAYYYDYEGKLMATVEIPDNVDSNVDYYGGSDLFRYLKWHMPYRIDEELAKVRVWNYDVGTERMELYRNGILEWSIDVKPGEYYYLDSHYYTLRREDSDYTYFYNYDGELCGKIADVAE